MIYNSIMQSKFLLILLAISCSSKSANEQAIRIITKGLTCDAVLTTNNEVVICGESNRYNTDGDSGNKDALCVLVQSNAKIKHTFSFGNKQLAERCERIVSHANGYYLTGTSGDEKLKFLLKTDRDFKILWSTQSSRFKTVDQAELGVNKNGFSMLSSKNPEDDSYQLSFHLFNADGACINSFRMNSIDIMQEIMITRNDQFLVSYKQKGAYIDGQTRKRYLMNTFHVINEQGEMLSSQKFLFDDDQVHGVEFSKVIEDANGHLYFIGTMDIQMGNSQLLYVLKSDINGQVIWSKMYTGADGMRLRSACFNSNGNIMLLGDGYGKKGGLIISEIGPDGKPLWAQLMPTPQYDQAIGILDDSKHYCIVMDKLFNIGFIYLNKKAKSCISDFKSINLEPQDMNVLTDRFNGKFETVEADWKSVEFDYKIHNDIESQDDCK